MNSITKEFKAAAEDRHEELRVNYIKHTQFAREDYVERLKDISKNEIREEWEKAGKANMDDIDYDVELDVNMHLSY